MNAYGDLTANDTIRFERMLPGPIQRVWAHRVEPGKRRPRLADGPMTLVPDGKWRCGSATPNCRATTTARQNAIARRKTAGRRMAGSSSANHHNGWHSPGATTRRDPTMPNRKSTSS